MSILSTPKAPKGFEMFQFPTRGGKSADIYSQLSGDVFQNLLRSAQNPDTSAQEKYGMDVFNQQIAPGIAQRYAGSGISGSSGMQNALAGAGGNLASKLQSERQNLMHQSMQDVLGLGNLLLQNPDIENYYSEKKGSGGDFWNKALGFGLPVLGGVAGGIFGGPMGAAAGASLGSGLGSAFSGQEQGKTDWSGIAGLPKDWSKWK
jgi:hypothetical protein